MNSFINTVLRPIGEFLASPIKRSLLFIGILCLIVLIDYLSLGVNRRTFVFYTIDEKTIVVEDRMLKHAKTKEDDIIRYVEETLLGPVSPELLPLLPRGTKLNSLLFREGIVYMDLSESAALPPIEGGNTLINFRTFHESILRNFSYINNVRFFIEGNAIFPGDFYIVN
ncbi:MAG: GerMN domain-containing protein [Treponema sp.]|nr:GerMN domain-containing protein [Treponema sp.]